MVFPPFRTCRGSRHATSSTCGNLPKPGRTVQLCKRRLHKSPGGMKMKTMSSLLNWNSDRNIDPASVLAVTLGMTLPLLTGFAVGQPLFGVFAALGSLALAGEWKVARFSAYLPRVLLVTICATLGFVLGSTLEVTNPVSILVVPSLFVVVGRRSSVRLADSVVHSPVRPQFSWYSPLLE